MKKRKEKKRKEEKRREEKRREKKRESGATAEKRDHVAQGGGG